MITRNDAENRDTAIFCDALDRGDLDMLRKVPKADLHTHGLLGGKLASYRLWCGCDLPVAPALFADFQDFDKYILEDIAYPYLGQSDARVREFFRFFLAETLREAIADGVIAIEPSLDHSFLDLYEGDPVAMVEDFQRVFDEVLSAAGNPPLIIRPELGFARRTPLELLHKNIPLALGTGFFRSIDLYGDERVGGVDEYVPFYRLARDLGLRTKAHSGELCSADHVRESVVKLDLDAVQHGIASAEDTSVMELLAKRGTVLNVCPTSNVRLSRARSIAEHPVRKLFDSGITVTINTDDLMVFDSTVSEEFLKLKQEGLFSAVELNQIRLNGLL